MKKVVATFSLCLLLLAFTALSALPVSSAEADSAAEATAESVDEYLSNLHCDGCRFHCSLKNPRCSRGAAKAKEARAQYEAERSGQ